MKRSTDEAQRENPRQDSAPAENRPAKSRPAKSRPAKKASARRPPPGRSARVLFLGVALSLSIPLTPGALPGQTAGGIEEARAGVGAQLRDPDPGISVQLDVVLEGFNNFGGGRRSGIVEGAVTLDLSVSLDSQTLFGWTGGKAYADLEDHSGKDPTTDLVGDLQVFDKLNAAPYLELFELWYQQQLFGDRLRLKIGKVDGNTEFSVNDHGLVFENSSAQVSPTVFLLPTTPAPMPSVNVFFDPGSRGHIGLGVYYANRSVSFGNFYGRPQDSQLSENGAFLIGEVGWKWAGGTVLSHDGSLKIGAWDHTGTFPRLDGTEQQGTHGWYALLNQTIWRPTGASSTGRGLGGFLEYGHTQRTINVIDRHVGGGMTWRGILGSRPRDVAGFNVQYAHISPQAGLPHSYELAVGGVYEATLTPWISLQLDFQQIAHPGGRYPAASVGTLRLISSF